jgi:hypothetical protein
MPWSGAVLVIQAREVPVNETVTEAPVASTRAKLPPEAPASSVVAQAS